VGRLRFEMKEAQGLRRGLLLRMRELLEEGKGLQATELSYSLFSRLEPGKKGRPHKTNGGWYFISHVVDSYL
jgi:hypothetical protein